MKSLNAEACAVFQVLIEGLDDLGDAKKIDNTEGTFMPVHVDFLGQNKNGRIFAMAHHYIQNGDVMQDPDMTFLVTDQGVYPLTFQQDSLAIYQEAAGIENGQFVTYDRAQQADLADFGNQWMHNIKEQQDLTPAPAPNPQPRNDNPSPTPS
jgi:hypothetical protein